MKPTKLFNLNKFRDNVALISAEMVITYGELEIVVNEFGRFVFACFKDNCYHKNLILHLCSNTIGSIAGYVAFMNNGQVDMLIANNTDIVCIKELLGKYQPEYIYIPIEKTGIVDMINMCNDGEGRVSCALVMHIYDYVLYRITLIDIGTNDTANINVTAKDTKGITTKHIINKQLALLLSTSGSLGNSRYVRLSYKNLHSNAMSIIEYLNIDSTERAITMLPMYYSYGLSVINSHLMAGASIVSTEKGITTPEFWRMIKEEKVTSLCGVPYTYEALYRLGFTGMSLTSIKTMTQAGGRLPDEYQCVYAEYAKNNGIKFYIMYGQTEATARMTYLPASDVEHKIGCVGVSIPGGAVYIDNTTGAYTEGEIVYKGANVSLGYASCREDLSKDDELCGVLHTGDIGYIDEEGYLYIRGRIKRFVKLCGKRVNLDVLEDELRSNCDFELYVNGWDDHITIMCVTDDTSSCEDIRRLASKLIGIHISLINLEHVDRISRNEVGKIIYNNL